MISTSLRRAGYHAVCQMLERRTLLSGVTFGAPVPYGSNSSLGDVIADVTGDGIPDIVAPESGAGSSVDVYLGTGTGTFGTGHNFSCASQTLGASQPYSVAVADVNGDGHMDIVTANFGGTLSVLLGIGDGTFGAATVYAASSEPNGIAVGDFNADGLMDIAVANRGSNTVGVYLNTGGGNFAAAVNLATGGGPDSLGAADFNHDGRLDLFSGNTTSNTVSVLLNLGGGNFAPAVNYSVSGGPNDAVTGDFNNDGNLDIATANINSAAVSILLGVGDGTFSTPITQSVTGVSAISIATADFNGDGNADVAAIGFGTNTAAVLLGNGDGTLQAPIYVTPGVPGGSVTAGDLNRDGKPDLVFGSYAGSGAAQFTTLINGGGTVTPPASPIKKIGVLDPTFGTGGLAAHNVGFTSTAGVAQQTDGKTVIAGTVGTSPTREFGLTRYNADGSLDTAFGTGGTIFESFNGSDDVPSAVTVLSSGDILVAGTATSFTNGAPSGSVFAVAEFTSTGVLDPAFGGGFGGTTVDFSSAGASATSVLHGMTVGAGGIIYLGGSSDASGTTGTDFALAELTATGAPVTTFGTGGQILKDYAGGDDVINSLALQKNGDIVLAGSATVGGITQIALARYLPSGILDKRFGTKGTLTTSARGVYDSAASVVITPKGQIDICGVSATGSGSSLTSDFVMARYTTAGKIDKTFGGGPVFPNFPQPAAGTQLMLQPNGDVIASGKTTASLTGLVADQLQVAVVRYTIRGVLDTTFNGTGKAIIDLSGGLTATAGTHSSTFSNTVIEPLDASSLGAEFAAFTASQQGVEALTSGGELLDAGNSGSNTVEAAIVTAGVDLAAAVIAKLPAAALQGARESLTVKITENGTDQATGTITVQLFASTDGIVDTGAAPFQSISERINLRQSQTRTVKLNYALPSSSGDFFVVANLAPGTLAELNANNNFAASAAAVTVAAPFIDLAGSSLVSIGTPTPGKTASITFSVTNNGNIVAKSVPVQILASPDGTAASGTQLAASTLRLGLAAGATRKYRLSFKIPATLPTGSYVLVAVLDPANTLEDPNLADNVIVGSVRFS